MTETVNTIEKETARERTHERCDYFANNILEAIYPEMCDLTNKTLSRLESGVSLHRFDNGERSSDGLSMNIEWGKSWQREAYDALCANYLNLVANGELGHDINEMPTIMKPAFEAFETGRFEVWSKFEVDGILLAAGVTISGTFKEEHRNDARLFPTDAGLWMVNGYELVEEIMNEIELKQGTETNNLEEKVKERLAVMVEAIKKNGKMTAESAEIDCLNAHGKNVEELTARDSFSDKTVDRLNREKFFLENQDQEWIENSCWVVSLTDEAIENKNIQWLENPLTGGPMTFAEIHILKGKLPPITGMGRDVIQQMPEYLSEELNREGWSPNAYYKQDGAIPFFAIAENGAVLGAMRDRGSFGGFQWDKPPIGKLRFFRGFEPKEAEKHREEMWKRWQQELDEISHDLGEETKRVEGLHPFVAVKLLREQTAAKREIAEKVQHKEELRKAHEDKLIKTLEEKGWANEKKSGANLPGSVVVVSEKSFGDKGNPDCLMIYPDGKMSEEELKNLINNISYGSVVKFTETDKGVFINISSEKPGWIIGPEGKHILAIKQALLNQFNKSIKVNIVMKELK